MRRVCLPLLVLAALLGPAATAQAEQTLTYRYGPIAIGGYQVDLRELVYDLPKPTVDGYLTGMEANVVDAKGAPLPVSRVMLHHVVFANLGRRVGERRDPICGRITMLDGRSQNPAYAERFFGVGEERVGGRLPEGYGYPVKGDDRWVATWMLMNHRGRADSVYIEYKVHYETQRPLIPVHPVWFDVRNCSFDPIFDVPGGGKRGSTYSTSAEWTVPSSGRIVAALGHLHGGGKNVAVSQPECNGREMFRSRPTWGRARDPEYTLRPRVHEPGPIDMELLTTRKGFPVAAGERLRLTTDYDNEFPHTRVMGIMGLYIAADPSVTSRCAPLPDDVEVIRKSRPGRSRVPLMHVPINARRGTSAVPIRRPVGLATWAAGGPLDVDNFSVEPANAVIPQGATLRWRFWGDTLHTVTVADGPRGFSSPNLSEGREFSYRFSKPGTYKLYCSLHPVDMSSTVKVVKRG